MAADMKLGSAPLGKAKDEAGGDNDDSEMDDGFMYIKGI